MIMIMVMIIIKLIDYQSCFGVYQWQMNQLQGYVIHFSGMKISHSWCEKPRQRELLKMCL